MKHTLLYLFLFALSFQSLAQDSTHLSLKIDINPGSASAAPSRLTAFNDKLVFFANDGNNGNELWCLTDTAITLVTDMNIGSADAGYVTNYTKMAVAAGNVYFGADNGITGQELYSWDGDLTTAPKLVADLNTSGTSGSTMINEVVSLHDKVYFPAFAAGQGYELWVHDPATLSTSQISNITVGSGSSNPQNLTVYKNMIYFSATSPVTGTELYKYDPKTNNTSLVMDIYSGTGSSSPQSLVVIDNILYFSATTLSYGRELYSFDSTTLTRLSDINPGTASAILASAPGQNRIGSLNGTVYFGGDDGTTGMQLYQHNKANGTQMVTFNINPSATSFPNSFITYGKNLYFAAYTDTKGIELWKYDGTNAPEMVADIDLVGSGNPMNFEIFKDVLYFSANTADSGTELYMLVDSTIFAGVKNVRFQADVKVYPNPASTQATFELNLQHNEVMNLDITDATGKKVYSTGMQSFSAGTSRINVPMADFASGVYFYNIHSNTGAGYLSGRLIKQ